jgi:hypothetical protein
LSDDGELELISERHAVDNDALNVANYSEFKTAALAKDYGDVVLSIHSEVLGDHRLYTYFRWVPASYEAHHRYLIVGGVSIHSIVTKISIVPDICIWGMLFVVSITTIIMYLVIIRQGLRVETIKDVLVTRLSCSEAKRCPLSNIHNNKD